MEELQAAMPDLCKLSGIKDSIEFNCIKGPNWYHRCPGAQTRWDGFQNTNLGALLTETYQGKVNSTMFQLLKRVAVADGLSAIMFL